MNKVTWLYPAPHTPLPLTMNQKEKKNEPATAN